jgi:hypothetical protein
VNKKIDFKVSPWEWFKLSLRVAALEAKGSSITVRYDFDEGERRGVICRIYLTDAQTMQSDDVNKREQLRFYKGFVRFQITDIRSVLKDIPELQKTLNIQRDVNFEILYSYGMGSALVCTITGNKVKWEK